MDLHQQLVSGLLEPTAVEALSPTAAAPRDLAREVIAPIAVPAFDASSMDGYAVRADDVVDARAEFPVRLPVTDDIPADRLWVQRLDAGTAQRIMTGAPLPPGAATVVPVEATDARLDFVRGFQLPARHPARRERSRRGQTG